MHVVRLWILPQLCAVKVVKATVSPSDQEAFSPTRRLLFVSFPIQRGQIHRHGALSNQQLHSHGVLRRWRFAFPVEREY